MGNGGNEGIFLHPMKGIDFTTQLKRDHLKWTYPERKDLNMGKGAVSAGLSGNSLWSGKSQKNAKVYTVALTPFSTHLNIYFSTSFGSPPKTLSAFAGARDDSSFLSF